LWDDLLAGLRDWQNAGIWELIHFSLLDWLAMGGLIGHAQYWTVVRFVRFLGASNRS
jgi:hypothetical protein